MNEVPETTQYDVNLPKPRTRKVLAGVLIAVLTLAIVGAAAAAIANRTAQEQADSTARAMPANTMVYFSLNTHTEKLPNFSVIADAWKDSKEARQVAAGLELAFTQAGLNWEEDVQPWLGDRVAVGLVDLGGQDSNASADQPSYLNYRPPFFLVAAQTKDRAKSDVALANLRKQLESNIKPSKFVTITVGDETYRGLPLVYMTTEYGSYMSDTPSRTSDTLAYATVDDLIVATTSRAQLQQIIDAALDGRNLSASENFKTVMSALPGQNAGAVYMDYGRLMPAYFDMIMGFSTNISVYSLPCEFEAKGSAATPDADCVKQRQEEEQRRSEQQRQLQEQMQQMREMLQAIGGIGMVMTYEPTGLRFDTAAQYDINQMPEKVRKAYEANQTPASGRVFASIPASAILAVNLNLQGAQWDQAFDLDQYAMQLSQLGVTKEEAAAKLAEFQKLIDVDLKTDFFELLNGEVAFVMLPQAEQTRSEFGFSMPFQFAALFDSSDAAKASSSLDKIVQAVSTLAGKDSIKWQSLSGLPYSVVLDPDGKPMLTYGVVDGRLVIGTDSDTLLSIDNAEQAPLVNNDLFKQATGLLPGNRLNTFFMNFQPLWDLVEKTSGTKNCQPCNYLKHFAWMSLGSEQPSNNGLELGSMHIGISK